MRRVVPLNICLSVVLFIAFLQATAQQITIHGHVREAATGEALPGATVYSDSVRAGTVTNKYGFFSLSLPAGNVRIAFSYVGFETQLRQITLLSDTTLTVFLREGSTQLEAVEVTSLSDFETAPAGKVNIPVERLKAVPALVGEPDIIRALSLMPGVSIGNEGTTGLLVRGGTPDQNLILLDEAVVYNASHIFGFASIFNPDAIRSAELYKAGFPARFGSRISSVVDITMKEGNNQRLTGDAGIGLVGSRLTIEGPVGTARRSSFMLSARSSYLSLFTLPSYISFRRGDTDLYNNFWLYDVNGKVNFKSGRKGQFFLSLYKGNDFLRALEGSPVEQSDFRLRWGNTTATARYTRVINPRLFYSAVLTYTRYIHGYLLSDYTLNNRHKIPGNEFSTASAIRDWTIKSRLEFFPNPAHQIQAGVEITHHDYRPVRIESSYTLDAGTLRTINETYEAVEIGAYVEDEIKVSDFIRMTMGIRHAIFHVEDTSYMSVEPRFNTNFFIPGDVVFKVSYARMRQFTHLLSSNSIGLPNDIWVPSTGNVVPQIADQLALNVTGKPGRMAEVSVGAFYKVMRQLIDYKTGTNFLASYTTNWQELVETSGKGEACGIEFFMNKTNGKLNGWVSYTLSYNRRQFGSINNGKWYAASFDRRHDFAVTGTYDLKENMSAAATWVFQSGRPFTVPIAVHEGLETLPALIYGDRNNYRMPSYHRLDVGLNFSKEKRHGVRTWHVGLYNAYNRINPFFVDLDKVYAFESVNKKVRTVNHTLIRKGFIPILPYVSYSLKF